MNPASTNSRSSNPLLSALLLVFAAIIADQLATPLLGTSTPLWAVLALLLLVWRRDENAPTLPLGIDGLRLSRWRLLIFAALHLALILAARALSSASSSTIPGALHDLAESAHNPGWLLATMKLLVLVPAFVLFPPRAWRAFAAIYRAEFIAALVVLLTFFPLRIMDALWPWYGQALGRFVYLAAWPLAPSLGYVKAFFPSITGPSLDVTIILACSGFNGVELFDYLFGLVAFCDWNRLRKGRTLVVYLAGIAAMLLGNALRIVSMVVFGNRGFAHQVLRFHLSAGWLFFSATFLIYLSLVYRWMLSGRCLAQTPDPSPATD